MIEAPLLMQFPWPAFGALWNDKGNARTIDDGDQYFRERDAHFGRWNGSQATNGLEAKISEPIATAMKRLYDDSKQSGSVKCFNDADKSRKGNYWSFRLFQ